MPRASQRTNRRRPSNSPFVDIRRNSPPTATRQMRKKGRLRDPSDKTYPDGLNVTRVSGATVEDPASKML